MHPRLPTWLAVLGTLAAAVPALAQEAGTMPGPGATPSVAPPAGAVRRPQGLPPSEAVNTPAPTPRPLTPAELEELRKRMVGNGRGVILTPGEIADVRRSVQEAQGAANFPGRDGRMPRPEPRIVTVGERASLQAPETLHLAYGVVSPITFVDGKDRPWPIASVAYDPRLFAQDGSGCGTDAGLGSAQVAAAAGSDRPTSINLMPCRFDTWGNILVRLEGVAHPVALMVLSGGNERVDIPITVRVAGISPLPSARPATTEPPRSGRTSVPAARGPVEPLGSDDTQLLHLFGAGTPPAGAHTLKTSAGAQAWLYRSRMYVRGPGTLLNPPAVATADAAGGMKVWQLARPASRLIAEGADGGDVAITVEY